MNRTVCPAPARDPGGSPAIPQLNSSLQPRQAKNNLLQGILWCELREFDVKLQLAEYCAPRLPLLVCIILNPCKPVLYFPTNLIVYLY